MYCLYHVQYTPYHTIPHAARYNRIFTKSNSTTIHINIPIEIRLYYHLSRLRSRSLGINMLNAFAQFVILCNIFHHSRFYDVLLSHYFCGAQKHCIGLDSLYFRMQKQHSFSIVVLVRGISQKWIFFSQSVFGYGSIRCCSHCTVCVGSFCKKYNM